MDLAKVGPGKKVPQEINVFIEIPQGVSVKYELDKESGMIFVDRFLYTDMDYPFNYGFVPGTLAGDGDPLDVLVLTTKPVSVGVVIPSKPIGLLVMEDEAGPDSKVIAVPLEKINPPFGKFQDIADVPQELKDQIRYFFENYKSKEPGKWVKVTGWKGKASALAEIEKSLK